ncbi:hypothetical protein GCM10023176_60520 [Micromonospora coerulea]|uniref:DDE superfamily endonuclease n=2 Tax=Micromonospora coerulea TaxID=47856 RepID=A0ABP8T6J7_9ACTN
MWRDFGLNPHQAQTFKLSSDPLFVDKVVDVVGLYHNPPERALLLYVDEESRSRSGSSWINQVERWFGDRTDQIIRRGVPKSVQPPLEADIRAWIKDWNDNPKPFVWTMTAEETLDSSAPYCRRISDARH